MVVAVKCEREAVRAPPEELNRGAVLAAGVERDRRDRGVVAVPVGMGQQLAVVDEAVAAPSQVGVVEEDRGAQWGRLIRVGSADTAQELDQRNQGKGALAEKRAQRSRRLELGQ